MLCPRCRVDLVFQKLAERSISYCNSCEGRLINSAVVKSIVGAQFVAHIFGNSKDAQGEALPCPSCHQAMLSSFVSSDDRQQEIDVCRSCQVIWFDAMELEAHAGASVSGKMPDGHKSVKAGAGLDYVAAQALLMAQPRSLDYTSPIQRLCRRLSLILLAGSGLVFKWVPITERTSAGFFFPLIGLALVWVAPQIGNYVGYSLCSKFGFVNRPTPAIVLEITGLLIMAYGLFYFAT